MNSRRTFRPILILTTLLILLIAAVPVFANGTVLDPTTDFYTVKPLHGAITQIADLTSSQDKADAALIKDVIDTPQAAWFTSGAPHEVQQDVKNTVKMAAAKKTVPVLVAYNIPFRDCSQYSAGGATTVAEYEAWIDGFANGIGEANAVVILEPDGLGIIPWYTNIDGNMEWCQPAEADPASAAADRFTMMNYAVDALKAQPNVRVYLDGTHSGWLGVGDNADRLVKAGVERADGFYLNVSNYNYTTNLIKYGTWVSQCIAQGDFAGCPNQYWNGGPDGSMIADLLGPWNGVALSNYGEWSDTAADPALNTSGYSTRFWAEGATHFVIDTSRNGMGPWQPPTGVYPDAQDWCNPPDRGLGIQPTADTGVPLLDAYLWVKIPGASDGECARGLGSAGETIDPEWGLIDPAAGAWFPEMALQLAQNANPPLQ